MAKFTCPFCGLLGDRSKEHPWPQWLHETEAARALLDGTFGERIPRPGSVLRKGQDGRYSVVTEDLGAYAKWLPKLTVFVCTRCNNEWMSQLEERVKQMLGPFLFGEKSFVTLTKDDLQILATWATKSWMTYALLEPTQSNPFTEAEYRAMASDPQPLGRCRIWLLHSTEARAHVGMGVASMLFSQGAPDLENAPDNAAHAYLAAAGVVLFMALVPPDAPEGFLDIFTPPASSHSGVRRIWPDPRRQYFPVMEVPDDLVSALLAFPEECAHQFGLPAVGLNEDEVSRVMQDFLDGAEPAELRHRWTVDDNK